MARFFAYFSRCVGSVLVFHYLLLNVLSTQVAAVPSIHVSLDIPWVDRSPYLLEIVETIAEEVPESYFPLLSHLVEFAHEALDLHDGSADYEGLDHKSIYQEALSYSQSQGYIPEIGGRLDWINVKLGLRTASARIQAYYQYYNDTILPEFSEALEACGTSSWFWFDNKVICDPAAIFALITPSSIDNPEILPFDKELSTKNGTPVAVLYADVTSPQFLAFHTALMAEAQGGKLRYILRYKPSDPSTADKFPERPKGLTGYGIELALKRTDYIVIDDRDNTESIESSTNDTLGESGQEPAIEGLLQTPDVQDIEPLSMLELEDISLHTAGYILFPHDDVEPMEVLLRITQDFPKYASTIAAAKLNNLGMLQYEMNQNLGPVTRASRFAHGDNAIYVNGARLDSVISDDIISMLDILDRERSLIYDLHSLNISFSDAAKLIFQATSLSTDDQSAEPRFDYTDRIEGGGALIYLNDIEHDFKYKKMSSKIKTLLDPHYPGQFHRIRKNIHVIVMPLDLSSMLDLYLLAKHIRPLIQREVPLRFGIVPLVETAAQRKQASIFYYLYENYGLGAAVSYAEESISHKGNPPKEVFEAVRAEYKPRRDAPSVDVDPTKEELSERLDKAAAWAKRLDVSESRPVVFGNGYTVPKDDGSWLQNVAYKLETDVVLLQKLVRVNAVTDKTNIQDFLIKSASPRRNKLVFPDDGSKELVDIVTLFRTNGNDVQALPTLQSLATPAIPNDDAAEDDDPTLPLDVSILVAADFDSKSGIHLFQETLKFVVSAGLSDNTQVRFLHNPGFEKNSPGLSTLIYFLSESGALSKISPIKLYEAVKDIDATNDFVKLPGIESLFTVQSDAKTDGWALPDNVMAFKFWESKRSLAKALDLGEGEGLVLLNNRAVRLTASEYLESDDYQSLLNYESSVRIPIAMQAASDIGLLTSLPKTVNRFDFVAQLSSILARSEDLDTSGGFFFSTAKRDVKVSNYTNEHCGFDVGGDFENAALKIVAVFDPATEFAQKYAPILNVLAEIEDVVVRIVLNPSLSVREMPVKRFYRNAISAAPRFADDGSLVESGTTFDGIPSDVLLTLGMDVSSAWLVTPKVSKYDLDNIILSSVSEPVVEAIYILKNILVQGHVRDMTRGGSPPAGLQLTLGTATNPHMADTIVMANLGYLQFKSEPGVWKLGLKPGPSEVIFNIESAGAHGYTPSALDENNVLVYLTKLSGITIYPRVQRNRGQETASVYGRDDTVVWEKGYLEQALDYVRGLIPPRAQAFIKGLLSRFWESASSSTKSRKSNTVASAPNQAEINIFSVASGHLYERFLNIMFVSVMRHTNSTVKFWLIDNFLSPSFKEFLPYMAKEYNFDYEFITYKWPHWLRAQHEKQRIIWGYKILFLDVMFPLDLEKVIFVDADQIVRTDMKELVDLDLEGAPYGYTPMCDSRKEIEGFRFWKQGYWKSFLGDKPYHISALYVIDLVQFRQMAAGDRLRQHYHQLSADPQSLSNLDQDLPNSMQDTIPIFSLPQDWLWCETWCSDESLKTAKTIDLCNNPMTKEPKLDRARRQLPEWTVYDNEIAEFANRVKIGKNVVGGEAIPVQSESPPKSRPLKDEL